eukprot:TRINITY_DN2308_c0_g1_i1.p1 TRINITY_DN2308_c0_g1~~TRINITY_DN2308_c0_g1_i1.p1  ORF type:complete len:472 (-),score=81.91 TRINITY_DN2308_c0_g1_i1:82-1467(-)
MEKDTIVKPLNPDQTIQGLQNNINTLETLSQRFLSHQNYACVIFHFYDAQDRSNDLFEWCAKHEIHDIFQFTRGASLLSKIIKYQLSLPDGKIFVQKVLANIARSIISQNKTLEIDPNRTDEKETAENNLTWFKELLSDLTNHISDYIDICPDNIRSILRIISRRFDEKQAEHRDSRICSYFFLHFFCPALVSPLEYNIIKSTEQLSASHQRSFLNASRLLQTLANGVDSPLLPHDYIQQNHDRLLQFVRRILESQTIVRIPDGELQKMSFEKAKEDLRRFMVYGSTVQSKHNDFDSGEGGQKIRESWEAVQDRMDLVGTILYQNLFEEHPSLKPLFNHLTMEKQAKKITAMIGFLVKSFGILESTNEEEKEGFVRSIWELGKRHIHYGVQSENTIKNLRKSFLIAMAHRDVLGERFEQYKPFWNKAFLNCERIMMQGFKDGTKHKEFDYQRVTKASCVIL